ncbi:MAG: hypothetical protein C4554_08165 [Dethiobacter sp.]|jgi:hypothetical protein|nr:MAG: hypothetical protein C4554_08165 [Dethiobacter sp.]
MIKKLLLLILCLFIIVGAAYYILWPMAQQYLAAVNIVLQPAIENIRETLPAVAPKEVAGIGDLIAILPILERIGVEGLVQIKEIAAGGVTREEAQQALDILSKQLSPEEIARLKALLNLLQF